MTAADYWAVARRRLVDVLGRSLGEEVLFVDDELVTYDPPTSIRVRRKDCFGLEDATRWESFLGSRPTWLHFNLLTIDHTLSVVTVRRSAASMRTDDERPVPVNVSAEPIPARVE